MDHSDVVTEEAENIFEDIRHVHVKPDNSLARKMTSHTMQYQVTSDHHVPGLSPFNVEEMIVYCLFALLIVFFCVYLVRCVRTTLDPYNTVARVTWLETLDKRESKVFQNIGLRAGNGPSPP